MLIFPTVLLVEFPVNILRRYDIDTTFTWRYDIISMPFRRHVGHKGVAYMKKLCITGRQRVVLPVFYVNNFFVKVIVH